MTGASHFHEPIARLRRGHQNAASELVRDDEPHVRRAIRMQLRDPRLRAILDATDICQSVMASFFARLALGEDSTPEALRKKLALVLNRVACELGLDEPNDL